MEITIATFLQGKDTISAQVKQSPQSFVYGKLQLWNVDNTIRPVVVYTMANTTHLPPEAISSMKINIALAYMRLMKFPLFNDQGSRELYRLKENNGKYSREVWKVL